MKVILTLIFSIFFAISVSAQQSPESIVREYVRLMNDWLASPYDMTKREKVVAILHPQNKKCTMKDEIVEKYNINAGTMQTDINGYLTIFSEKTKSQIIHVEIQSIQNSSNAGINIATVVIKYLGGISLTTATDFWIFDGKIGYIGTNDLEKYKLRNEMVDNTTPIEPEIKQIFNKALTSIKFESGKAMILRSSYPVLDQVLKVMIENPDYKLIISGHTDSSGDSVKNMMLSKERADAVKQYLIVHGVPGHRLTTEGYGDTRPIADNMTANGRALNRRIEFQIISN